VQAGGRARAAPLFRRRRGREDGRSPRTTMHVGTRPIGDVVRVTETASISPPATAPEHRRRAGSADGLHQAGRYGPAPRRRGNVRPTLATAVRPVPVRTMVPVQIGRPHSPVEGVGRMRAVFVGEMGRALRGGPTQDRSLRPVGGETLADVLRGGLYGARPERGWGGGQAPHPPTVHVSLSRDRCCDRTCSYGW
jgi:hypothetical protein